MSDNTLNEIIRDHAMLVSVHIKHWTASVKDNEAARAAAEKSGASGSGAYKAHKNLMFRHDDRLKAVLKAGTELRNIHNAMTMAWDTGKSPFRMLPTVQFNEYTVVVSKAKAKYDKALKVFMDNYLSDAAAARRALNIENDPLAHRLYPTESQLASRFGVELNFEPIPEGRQFRNIPDSAVTALSKAHEDKVAKRYREALAEACTQVAESMSHLREALKADTEDGKAQRWKDSSVTNIVEQVRLLKHFDLEGNEQLSDWCDTVYAYFDTFSKKALVALRAPGAEEDRIGVCDRIAMFEVRFEEILEDAREAA